MRTHTSASSAERSRNGFGHATRHKFCGAALAACTVTAISIGLLPGIAHGAPPAGAEQLEQGVDDLVQDFIAETGLPGMTVAVSQDGRLVHTEGYGSALVDGTTKLPMKADMRGLIGSVTKATITGPSAYQLLKEEQIDPQTQTLYGPNGLFEGGFDADIDQGIADFAPESANWKEWYEEITVQNLFDHEAGFELGASKADAAAMFGVTEDELTQEQYHRYFLRTSKLLHEPGTYEYSNHGFGLFTLIIEKVAGQPFYDYVRDDYLKPMNLHNGIQPSRFYPDSCDAHNHKYSAGNIDALSTSPFPPPEPLAFEQTRLGMAAGGFRSSAQDLVGIMKNLEQKYAWEEIDSMGWFMNSKGRLSHNGLISGGTASVVMFPEGYMSSGLDLSGVHVAVVTNIRLENGDIDELARLIALEVPASDVGPTHDLWPQVLASKSCEYSRHGVPSSEYQEVFDWATSTGYRLEWIDGYTVEGKVYFNAIFRAPGQGSWVSHHDMTGETYQQNFDKYVEAGHSLVHVDSYAVGNTVRYAAIWSKNSGEFVAYHGKTVADHQASFDELTAGGWRPRAISVASVSGKLYYTALYTKQAIGNYEARSYLTPAEYQAKFDTNKAAGRRLRYLNA